jgi:hypothetical protein
MTLMAIFFEKQTLKWGFLIKLQLLRYIIQHL